MAETYTTDLFKGRNLIVFDGECVLCSGFFRFMLKRDKDRRFEFATAQSLLGQRMYKALNLPVVDYETNLVIVDGKIFQRLDAFAAAVRALPGGWPFLSLVRFLPSAVKDPLYFSIARNRYTLFGRYDTCMIPDAALLERFAEQGFDAWRIRFFGLWQTQVFCPNPCETCITAQVNMSANAISNVARVFSFNSRLNWDDFPLRADMCPFGW